MTETKTLSELLAQAKQHYDEMTPSEREIMLQKQRESYVRAESSWPKPNYHYERINGEEVKIYHSYEDYLND